MKIHSSRGTYVTLTLGIIVLIIIGANYSLVQPGLWGAVMLLVIRWLAGLVALWTYAFDFLLYVLINFWI
ncbi:hypothetical protein [Lentilactobacillus kosonis]|nr:hypothetical protein [Lentilactobacillus kosonis]